MKYIYIGVLILLLVGCSKWMTPEAIVTSKEDAKTIVEAIQYVKAQNGICYGIATIERVSTGGNLAQSQVIVSVDCARVNL